MATCYVVVYNNIYRITIMIQIQSKLPAQGVTIFSVMSALAQRLNALNLSQGFPDFRCK